MKTTICDVCGKTLESGYLVSVKQQNFKPNTCCCIEPTIDYDLCFECFENLNKYLSEDFGK